ncbi:MAG: hypothetical protein JWQ95_6372 [Sphaerisporangium sp.]|jgi:hypothetical protein|nr:hypothetical protein [Sphaerisporangium sp.]
MATLRSPAISLLRLVCWEKITEANRHMTAHPVNALGLIGLTV